MHESIELIKRYIPSLFEIFNPGDTQFAKITTSYDNRIKRIKKCGEKGDIYKAKNTLFDLFWNACDNDQDSYLLLKFIERTINELNQKVPANLKSGVGKICYKMIVDFNESNSNYSNYLSELSTINKLLSDNKTTLLTPEFTLPNGKSFDFKIMREEKTYLLEIYNILVDVSKIESENSFKEFLIKRLDNKLNDKLQNLDSFPEFILVPVLWTKEGNLLSYSNVSSYIRNKYNNISYFMVFSKFYSPKTKKSFYEFLTLESCATLHRKNMVTY
ncbi:MAG: hypothetical protein H8D23_40525 [Candidatus Brocadiales bacterium]|nr:hypothetical protein [Candidatus Brocadiales bacterium]